MSPLNCDVLVVGGGAAGVAAAVTAARAGVEVVLLERYGFLGGLATAGLVGTVCGAYLRDQTDAPPKAVAGGFVLEFLARLQRASGTAPLRLDPGLWVLPFAAWAFERVAHAVVSETDRITPVMHATLTEAHTEGARLASVRALAWNEGLDILPRCAVDCSGEAVTIALAGGAVLEPQAEQVPALVFVMDRVAPEFTERARLDTLRSVRQAVDQGRLAAGCAGLTFVPGTGVGGRVVCKLNLAPAACRTPAWQQVTAWEFAGRALVAELERFLVANVAAFHAATLVQVAPQVGVRAGRRIVGRGLLTDEDVQQCHKSASGVARGAWPAELWPAPRRTKLTCFRERDFFEIPLDCLRPKGLDNVFAAGRCLSAAPGALASARVIGTALGTGMAAGHLTAALAQKKSLRGAVEEIRRRLAE
jgi:hypothetical protein